MSKNISRVFLIILAVSLLVLWLPQPAQASRLQRMIVGGNFTLSNGETLDEDLLVVGGLITLENGSTLHGDILMVGGSLIAAGKIDGDVVVAGGLLEIAATAIIDGDITAAGANLQRDPDAVITGDITTEQEGPFVVTPTGIRLPQLNLATSPSFSIVSFVLGVILWALLAMLLALFLPNQLRNVSHAVMAQPLISGGLGLLTAVVLPIVLVLIALTILLIPLSLLGFLLLVLAWAFGMVALGSELGNRFAGIFKSEWHPALSAGAGTLLLMLLVNGLWAAIPCLGWLPMIVLGFLGLGGVLLTRFGRQAYPPAAQPAIREIESPSEPSQPVNPPTP
jgi:hypothetical protein